MLLPSLKNGKIVICFGPSPTTSHPSGMNYKKGNRSWGCSLQQNTFCKNFDKYILNWCIFTNCGGWSIFTESSCCSFWDTFDQPDLPDLHFLQYFIVYIRNHRWTVQNSQVVRGFLSFVCVCKCFLPGGRNFHKLCKWSLVKSSHLVKFTVSWKFRLSQKR